MNVDQPYLHNLSQIDFEPVFILGVHRSGTSILYKMLTATGCFNSVTAYHLIKYKELLSNHLHKREEQVKQELTESFKEKGVEDRGIDRLILTADFSEEYGFLLGQQTFHMYLTSKNLQLFIELCRKIQYLAGNKKPLLLKNPYDFPNFLYIKQMFPTAKFVFIHRHPLKTISSTMKTIDVLLQKKNPYTMQLFRLYNKVVDQPVIFFLLRVIFSTVPELGVLFLARTTRKATEYYLKNIEKLPKQDYISITYESFCEYPEQTIEQILKILNLKKPRNLDVSSLMEPRKVNIDLSVKKGRNFIYSSMKKYYTVFGYE